MFRTRRRFVATLACVIIATAITGMLLPLTSAFAQSVSDRSAGVSHDAAAMAPFATGMSMAAPQPGSNSVSSVASGSWSDPKTWSGGHVPSGGQDIIISAGDIVTYDLQSSPVFGVVLVQGSLAFSRSLSTSMAMTNMTIDTSGYVEVGTVSSPIPPSVTAVIKLSAATEGSAKIMVMGHLEIHGSPVSPTWTKLAESARAGDTVVNLAQPVGWNSGDHIVITSTSLMPQESEENTVTSVSGTRVTLAQPLKYGHDSTAPASGEVADLTRNVVVTSFDPMIHATGVMFVYGATGGLSYAEFSHLGGRSILGDYPIHFHHVQDSMVGTVVQGVSVWDSHNRFITIHNTDGITVKDSVGYKSIGHGFFLEDGTEHNNVLVNNIAIMTLPGKIRPDDGGAAGFWIQNPQNNVTKDVSVSAAGNGFDYALPDSAPQVIPFNEGNFEASLNQATTPRGLKILAFANNEAHSNRGDGIHLYRLNMVRDRTVNLFSGMLMWRNGFVGVDVTAAQTNITRSTFFGNRNGNSRVEGNDVTIGNSRFMGELNGVQTTSSHGRYAASPFGLLLTPTRVNVVNDVFTGHTSTGTIASADIIDAPNGFQRVSVTIQNTSLESQHTIVIGYPLEGSSYFNVIALNGDPAQSFTLLRYDILSSTGLQLPPACALDSNYMAVKCPLLSPTFWKGTK